MNARQAIFAVAGLAGLLALGHWRSAWGPPAAPGTGQAPVVPLEDPARVDLIVTYRGKARTYQALVDGLGEAPLGAASPGALLGALTGLTSPALEAHATEFAVAFVDGRGPTQAVARVERLPEGWRLDDDGGPRARLVAAELRPWSARWIPALPGEGGRVALARAPEDLREAVGWLDASVLADAGEALRLEVPERMAAAVALPRLEAELDATVVEARRSIARERAARDAAPALGDPEALVDAAEEGARALLGWLPDVRGVRATLSGGPAGVELEVRLAYAPGSPLARAIAARSTVAPELAALPADTAFAFQGPGRLADVLARVAGARLPGDGAQALAESMPPGPWRLALGASPWLRLDPAPTAEALDAFVETGYGARLLGALLGCPRARPGDAPCHGVTRVAPGAGLVLHRAPAEGTPLQEVPAAARVLADAPEGLAHAYLEAQRVPATLGLMGALGASARAPGRARPMRATLRHAPRRQALVLELKAAPGAFASLRALAALGSE